MTGTKHSSIIDVITRFQLSGAYPVFFALLCALSGLCDKYGYLSILFVLSGSVVFSALFVKDNKVFLVPIFMMYYALGTDNQNAYQLSKGDILEAFDSDAFICILGIAAILVITLVVRFILDGTFKYALTHRGLFFWSVIFIDIALISNGAFSPYWSWACTLYGAMLAAGLTLFYLILHPIVMRSLKEIIDYACICMFLAACVVLIQTVVLAAHAQSLGNLVFYEPGQDTWLISRTFFVRSWGVTTVIGGVVVLGIPAALKLARDRKLPIPYYISAILFFLAACLVNTRSAMLAGAFALVCGIIVICASGKNRKTNLIFTISLLVIGLSALVAIAVKLHGQGLLDHYLGELYTLFRFNETGDRPTIWEEGMKDIQKGLFFGVGLSKGGFAQSLENANILAKMYHNIFLQFAASMGSLGILAFIFHLKDFFVLGLSKISARRLLILLLPLMIIIMSLFDNFFFYLNFQIFYVAFFALAEKELEITKNGLD